ncbi:hypothetical protein [Sorangium sp. So ce124]|uniref:hypothetical protein n=1 Tax=Sorangium sp. So ce124 TaxID=3133280 RepID=UPI003F602E4F
MLSPRACRAVFRSSGAVTRFGYDASGRRTSVIDPLGAVVRFACSGRGDHVATYDEQGGVTRYAYDGEAKMTQVTWPSGRVPRSRVPVGRRKSRRYGDIEP